MKKILKINKKKKKKGLYYLCFPFVLLWMALGVGIMKLGDGLHWLGNAMTGFKADKSIGTAYFE